MVVNSHGRGNLRGTPLRARNANVRLRPSSDVRVAHDGRLLMRSPTPPQAATAVRSQTRGKVHQTSLEAIAPENRSGCCANPILGPVVKRYKTDLDKYGTVDQGFNVICTTYRLTEHYHYWTKNNL